MANHHNFYHSAKISQAAAKAERNGEPVLELFGVLLLVLIAAWVGYHLFFDDDDPPPVGE